MDSTTEPPTQRAALLPASLPSLNALRAFEAAARHLSFSKAAEELHVTPAAVSHLVKTLESHLDVTLFHRLNRGLALTDAAMGAQAHLQRGFRELAQAVQHLRRDARAQSLAVQAPPSFADKVLVPRLGSFRAAQPDVDLRLSAALSVLDTSQADTEVRGAFRGAACDVAIRFGHGNYSGCHVERLLDVWVVPLCSPELLRGEHPLRTPTDLRHHVLLHDETPYEDHPQWPTWLEAAGASSVDATRGPRFNSVSLALQAAVDGQGVALGIEALAVEELASGRLVAPFDFRMRLQSAYYLVSLRETAELPRIAAFRKWLLAQTSELQARVSERAAA